jgi:hypothetical protein
VTSSRAHLAWESGGQARFDSLQGDAIVVVSSVASPPGSRPVGTLLGAPPEKVRMKVHACRLQPDGSFRIEGRLIDATRAMRARLEALVGAITPAPGSTSSAPPGGPRAT